MASLFSIYKKNFSGRWVTLARINCKNVFLATDPASRRKPTGKSTARPEIVWRRVVIKPVMGKVSSSSADSGSDIRFHGVRGHFSDYRSGKGLFGKHRGVYWVPAHYRGTIEAGMVLQDYKLAS